MYRPKHYHLPGNGDGMNRDMTEKEQGFAIGICISNCSGTYCAIAPWNDYRGCGACILIDASGLTPCHPDWKPPQVPQKFNIRR